MLALDVPRGRSLQVTTDAVKRWSLEAVPATVPFLRAEVTDFAKAAGVAETPLVHVRLALTEALTNAVIHGYGDDGAPGTVDLEVTITGADIRVVVADNGRGMRPRVGSAGIGIGLPLISAVAESVEIQAREPQGTELHIRFAR